MTPARKAALQFFHIQGETHDLHPDLGDPSMNMVGKMMDDGQLGWAKHYGYRLTDKGRRMLHGDDK